MISRVVKVARKCSRESITIMAVPARSGSVRSFRVSRLLLLMFCLLACFAVLSSVVWGYCMVHRLQHAQMTLSMQKLDIVELQRSRRELQSIITGQNDQIRDFAHQTYLLQQRLAELEEQTLEIRDVLAERKAENSHNKWISALKLPEINLLTPSCLASGGPSEPFTKTSVGDVTKDVITRMSLQLPSTSAALEILRENALKYQRIVSHTPSLWPAKGPISSAFGYRTHPVTGQWKMHEGLDIAAAYGTPVCAAGAGMVIHAGEKGAYGYAVIIDHDYGLQTLYAHMSRILVRRGSRVEKGDHIGLVGSSGVSTGPHLHYEVWQDGRPVNPADYLD